MRNGDKRIKSNKGNKSDSLASLEEVVRNQTKRKRIETALLGSVSLAGFLTAAFMAPNAVTVLHKALPDLRPVNQKQSIKRAIGRMIQKGYLEKKENKYHLTKTGEQRLLTLLAATNYYSGSKKKWDGKWRMVTYDIPEKHKQKRDILRNRLVQAGFVKVQGSVWVYPYQCNEIVALLKFEIKLGKHALYLIVDAIEGDEWLKKRFGLPVDTTGKK